MKKINTQFLILQSLAIIFVVLGHSGGISILEEWFPVYSFHIPLFIFISGYFYKNDMSILDYIVKKFKSLIIPYYIWNFIYGIIATILTTQNIISFASKIDLKSLFVEPWITGSQFGLNLASWFVTTLFLVQILNHIFRNIYNKVCLNNEYILMIIYLVIGIYGIFLANSGHYLNFNLIFIRIMFLIPFYNLGYLYKVFLEKKDNLDNIRYFIIIFIIQFIVLYKYGDIRFSALYCNNFNKGNILLPYITSITGILFWLRISKLLNASLRNSKVINYIGRNTWTIMMHHQLVFFIFNYVIYKISTYINHINFDYIKFTTDAWYKIDVKDERFWIIYVIMGIFSPLIVKYKFVNLLKKVKLKITILDN